MFHCTVIFNFIVYNLEEMFNFSHLILISFTWQLNYFTCSQIFYSAVFNITSYGIIWQEHF